MYGRLFLRWVSAYVLSLPRGNCLFLDFGLVVFPVTWTLWCIQEKLRICGLSGFLSFFLSFFLSLPSFLPFFFLSCFFHLKQKPHRFLKASFLRNNYLKPLILKIKKSKPTEITSLIQQSLSCSTQHPWDNRYKLEEQKIRSNLNGHYDIG